MNLAKCHHPEQAHSWTLVSHSPQRSWPQFSFACYSSLLMDGLQINGVSSPLIRPVLFHSPRFDPIILLTVPSTEKVLKTRDKQRSSPTYSKSMCQPGHHGPQNSFSKHISLCIFPPTGFFQRKISWSNHLCCYLRR